MLLTLAHKSSNVLIITALLFIPLLGAAQKNTQNSPAISIKQEEKCPDWLDTNVKKLRSNDTINLCELKQDKVLLIVNTASACGFTPQFEDLEKLYQKYQEKGLEIIGFPSDSFWQEHDDAEKTAEICHINYGVTFTMLNSTDVRGNQANSVFTHLAKEKGAPKWNFYKYLVGRDGEVIDWYNSRTKPYDQKIIQAIEYALKTPTGSSRL